MVSFNLKVILEIKCNHKQKNSKAVKGMDIFWNDTMNMYCDM